MRQQSAAPPMAGRHLDAPVGDFEQTTALAHVADGSSEGSADEGTRTVMVIQPRTGIAVPIGRSVSQGTSEGHLCAVTPMQRFKFTTGTRSGKYAV